MLIAVITTILSATLTEVTARGIVAFVLAITALSLSSKSGSDPILQPNRTIWTASNTSLLDDDVKSLRAIPIVRLVVGCVCAGALFAVGIATSSSFLVNQVLSRLN